MNIEQVTLEAMKTRKLVLERSADELLKQGRESEAVIYQLKADKLQEKIDIEESNQPIQICPSCKMDLGSNQENCKKCFDSIPDNEGYCWGCGEKKGTNDDCFECREHIQELYEYRRELEAGL